jgi:hypothetical protein
MTDYFEKQATGLDFLGASKIKGLTPAAGNGQPVIFEQLLALQEQITALKNRQSLAMVDEIYFNDSDLDFTDNELNFE